VAKWVRIVAGMGMKVILQIFFIGKLERKSPFRRPMSMWEDNIEVDFTEFYQNGF
jgi:hypothetical protein